MDDYWAYKINNKDQDYGKLLLIDQYDYTVQQIFFDDIVYFNSEGQENWKLNTVAVLLEACKG